MSETFQKFGVIGGGAWGTALASALVRAGRDVTLWTFEKECSEAINTRHENTLYLPGVKLDPAIKATSDLADLAGMDAVLAVPPAQHMRGTLKAFAPYAKAGLPVILCSKGIEHKSLSFMAGVLNGVLPQARAAVLSGPSFAIDVVNGLPAAVTLACEDDELGEALGDAIASPGFRPYMTDDIIGSEIGGAVKNVLAIACGLVLGKGLGRSAHAAIIARGFREMTRLGVAMGAQPETLTGMSGLGDLVLTCSSETSRNMSCGLALGRGQSLEEIMNARSAVTEGVATAPALKQLASEQGVEMPICEAMADILSGEIGVDAAILRLLSRERRLESE
ncbi:NAD(P)H-dependent glycerol-3-phosphate dehydrogenase [Robiginitomaculum antarcticum]|uniref:NAD(P)H-dependent glycerol-3-phosphate dehydrogenase n=1 Tax=Robiginitomaculum antarcticum TaxID=437507 RepID=UPI000376832C|nr:NAD(P)H-dependent glycerol-3-phosphate dehydrogenase [Robiginitomaculum antarcticum]